MNEPTPELNGVVMTIFFGLVQGILVLYFFTIKQKSREHQPFIWLIIALMITQMESLLLRSGYMGFIPHLVNISTPLSFLFGPLLYEYIRLQLGKKTRLMTRVAHLLPFLFYLGYSFYFFLQPEDYKYNAFASDFHPEWTLKPIETSFSVDPWNIRGWIVVEIMTLHILLYCIACFYQIRKGSTSIKKVTKAQIQWLLYLSGLFTLAGIMLFFSQGGIINGEVFFKSPFPHYSVDLFGTVGMYLLTGYLLKQSDLFKRPDRKYKKSSLSALFKKEKLKQLMTIIENDSLYLDPDFSLDTLAEKSKLSKHHISQIFNEELQSNFFQLTNRYRIEEAKRRLEEEGEYVKMEQLAYALGYKSKSTFYTAFKKATSLTPAKYRALTLS